MDRDDDPSIVVSTQGGSRYMRQVNLITNISGTTVTVKNPLLMNFNTGNPKVHYTFSAISFSGIEDLRLDHSTAGSGNNLQFQYCYACWLKGVESYKPAGYHMVILGTLNLEIRDSFVHEAQTFGNNNGGLAVYGSPLYGGNSTGMIENSIFQRSSRDRDAEQLERLLHQLQLLVWVCRDVIGSAGRVDVRRQSRPARHAEPVGR